MDARTLALAQPDLQPEPVVIPEWGGVTVYVKPLDGFETARLFSGADGGNPARDLVRLAVFTATNADGSPVFTEDDIPALRKKPQVPFVRIADKALILNRLAGDGADPKND
jgi:hypothetical protein